MLNPPKRRIKMARNTTKDTRASDWTVMITEMVTTEIEIVDTVTEAETRGGIEMWMVM